MALGHVFHLMWGTEEIDEWIFGLMGALGLELVFWEMIGNSDFVQNKVRDQDGDVIGNTLGRYLLIFFCEMRYKMLLKKEILSKVS